MIVRWQKLDERRHRFTVLRDAHAPLEATLETRSFLVHDFAHFAVEQQAGLVDGFYGALARGATFDTLRDDVSLPPDHERWRAERMAALFQTLWRAEGTDAFAERCVWYRDSVDVDDAFIDGAVARMRALMGHWRGTPFGAFMERTWP